HELCGLATEVCLPVAHGDGELADEGRIAEDPALLDLSRIEGCVIIVDDVLVDGVRGLPGLYHHQSLVVFATRAAADLYERLEGALCRSEIRDGERLVRLDDADQANVVEFQ